MRVERERGRSCPSLLLATLLVCSLEIRVQGASEPPQIGADTPESGQVTRLQNEKLREEVRRLRLENEALSSPWHPVVSNSTFIVALTAVVGVILTLWKQIGETARQRRQTADEQLRYVLGNLGSESQATQCSAAALLLTFIPDRADYSMFVILLAHLRTAHEEEVRRLLVQAFGRVVKEIERRAGERPELDFSRAYLERVDLSGLNLTGADLYLADLRGADLTGTNLFRATGGKADLEKARLSRANLNEARMQEAKCHKAQLHEAILHEANFRKADLREAQFQQAKLQSAHFDDADLRGARFEQATLSNTFFLGTRLDDAALNSILKAYNWRDAHFDEATQAKLQELAARKA